MKISELIKKLRAIKRREGDLGVYYDYLGQEESVDIVAVEDVEDNGKGVFLN